MKTFCISLLIFIFPLVVSCKPDVNPVQPVDTIHKSTVLLGDPFIILHDNTYYAYGTKSDDGIEVYTSDDLKTWKLSNNLALNKKDSWGDRWFWAPEVYYVNDKFYMYYSADEHICVATSDSPLGPFIQNEKKPMLPNEKCIDNSLFIDSDGKSYLYFDRFNDGLNIWVAELDETLLNIKEETLKQSIHVSQSWEEVWPRVNEGAYVMKHNDLYYMTYSANSFESPFYGIGFATAKSPLGPWTKYDKNPILQKPKNLQGVGHSAMFTDKSGALRIVFHAHKDSNNIHPRGMYISNVTFTEDSQPIMQIGTDIENTILIP